MFYFLLIFISLYLISLGFIVGVYAGQVHFGFIVEDNKPYEQVIVAIFIPVIFFMLVLEDDCKAIFWNRRKIICQYKLI